MMTTGLTAGDHLLSLEINGIQREYLVHVPAKRMNRPRPVVILLHGTGGSVRWTQEESRFDALSDRAGFLAVYPQALTPDPNHPPKFIANPPFWNAGSTLFPEHKPDDLQFIRALLDDLPRHATIDPARIYFTGFSNGAAMCFEVAAALGDRIAAIAPVAGYCRAKRIRRPVPTLFIIGSDDPMVPLHGGTVTSPWTGEKKKRPPAFEGLDLWAELLGCVPSRRLISDGQCVRIEQYPGPVEFKVMIVDGLGHHWPGGRGRLKKKLAGEPSDVLDANQALWSFFQLHFLSHANST